MTCRMLGTLVLTVLAGATSASASDTIARATVGYANVFDAHAAFGASARVRIGRLFFAEPELLWLRADGHSDVGPVFHVGISGGTARAQVALAAGLGPVQGLNDDDGLVCLSFGAALRVRESGRLWIIPETRIGILGETGYFQAAIGVGYRLGSK